MAKLFVWNPNIGFSGGLDPAWAVIQTLSNDYWFWIVTVSVINVEINSANIPKLHVISTVAWYQIRQDDLLSDHSGDTANRAQLFQIVSWCRSLPQTIYWPWLDAQKILESRNNTNPLSSNISIKRDGRQGLHWETEFASIGSNHSRVLLESISIDSFPDRFSSWNISADFSPRHPKNKSAEIFWREQGRDPKWIQRRSSSCDVPQSIFLFS